MALTPKQGKHIADISVAVCRRIEAKYRKGQKEHGGNLWEKEGMLENIMDEITDLLVYAHTLREQMENLRGMIDIDRKGSKEAAMIQKILNKPND